jgi:hypothetical protein
MEGDKMMGRGDMCEEKKCIRDFCREYHLEDLDVNRSVIIKWFLRKVT